VTRVASVLRGYGDQSGDWTVLTLPFFETVEAIRP
jgi:hypothetical protein